MIGKGKTGMIGGASVNKGGSKPVYISVGHRVSLNTAVRIVQKCYLGDRSIPAPIHSADQESRHQLGTRTRGACRRVIATCTGYEGRSRYDNAQRTPAFPAHLRGTAAKTSPNEEVFTLATGKHTFKPKVVPPRQRYTSSHPQVTLAKEASDHERERPFERVAATHRGSR